MIIKAGEIVAVFLGILLGIGFVVFCGWLANLIERIICAVVCARSERARLRKIVRELVDWGEGQDISIADIVAEAKAVYGVEGDRK